MLEARDGFLKCATHKATKKRTAKAGGKNVPPDNKDEISAPMLVNGEKTNAFYNSSNRFPGVLAD